jgi:hypothetical protein
MNDLGRQVTGRIGPRIEIIVWRDPDSSNEVAVFVDGVAIDNAEVINIDPGAGCSRSDWEESAAGAVAAATPAAAVLIADWFGLAGDSSYITDEDDD